MAQEAVESGAPPSSTAVPALEARAVGKVYSASRQPVTVFERLDFAVAAGAFTTIVGPSGCGKTTLLLLLAGLAPASSGEVLLQGRPVRGPQPADVSVIFQDANLLPWKTTRQNVEFPLELRGVPKGERRAQAEALLDLVGLRDFGDRYPHELSGGMRQRVAIARGLIQDPQILLLDEPFAALDEQTRMKMGAELLRIWEQRRKTVLFVTHNLTEATFLSDRVLVLGPRPARVLADIAIDLPRPRDFELMATEHFGRLRDRMWRLIMASEQQTGLAQP
ncbi:MAG TPA: ABC transporter ATP-binding protein [Chloroflexota bacterium]|jgi:NitT/TauT family transport system ATP-binding protein